MSNDDLHVDWYGLQQGGWCHSLEATIRMANKGRFPRPFRRGPSLESLVWKTREVRPFLSKSHLARR
jgi:hypothetical protein